MSQRKQRERDPRRPAVAAATVLLIGSGLPLPSRYKPDFGWLGPDKLLHLVGHAAFVALLGRGVDHDGQLGTAGEAVAVSTAYGLAIELLQESVPGRAFEPGDVVAGFLGSLIGLAAWRRLER